MYKANSKEYTRTLHDKIKNKTIVANDKLIYSQLIVELISFSYPIPDYFPLVKAKMNINETKSSVFEDYLCYFSEPNQANYSRDRH